ncbi:MAG: hypothetical protein AABX16_04075 [Nanoarchaeota archaeon]
MNTKNKNLDLNKIKKKDNITANVLIVNKNRNSKMAQAEIITTVLLILLSIIGVMIIMSFAIPFVREQLSGGDCFDVVNEISISANRAYTCYDAANISMRLQIHYKNNASLGGFSVELGGATTKNYIVKSDSIPSSITLYPTGLFEFPGMNEERTYRISGVAQKPDKIKVYPILASGDTCDSSAEINTIPTCR